ncbi:MAG: hypothetical protein V4649_16890 [Bacteroidota bacterium]
MKQKVRELLVTAKVAEDWQGTFEQKVDELMELVNRTDTEKNIHRTVELLDVYHKSMQKPARIKKKKLADSDKPFEFLVFRN